jgi:hypothetical protein
MGCKDFPCDPPVISAAPRPHLPNFGVARELEIKNVSGPLPLYCGGFIWRIRWEFTAASIKGGYVVQYLEYTADVKDCDGNKISKNTSDFPLWEAWEIKPNSKQTIYADKNISYDDQYSNPNMGDCTQGTVKFKGKAEFYEGVILPQGMVPTNKPPTAELPTTKTNPNFSGGTASVDHIAEISWNCCPKGTQGISTYKTTPDPYISK